jgi:hypothetical protein
MSLGNCTCEDWNKSAMDLSDRILNSLIEFPVGGLPMFDFCPYCGRKLVQAGAGHKHVGMWHGKPLWEYNHQELIDIINQIQKELSVFDDEATERIRRIGTGTL